MSNWSNGKKSGKVIFGNSGFEAVESALKTSMLATGKRGIIAFTGAYHGLGYGALNATHRDFFRGPFLSQLRQFGHFVPFPGPPRGPRKKGEDITGPNMEGGEKKKKKKKKPPPPLEH